jgi:hypothetical protein
MKILFALLLIALCSGAMAQDSLKTLNYNRDLLMVRGTSVLGAFGTLDIAGGVIGWANSEGKENRGFYKMTTIWGVINLAVAIPGFIHAENDENKVLTAEASLRAQVNLEKVFLANGGLDVVYIGVGVVLNHRGNDDYGHDLQLAGYGKAIAVQGAALLLFDATMYGCERNNGNKLRRFLEKHPIGFTGKGIGMSMHI